MVNFQGFFMLWKQGFVCSINAVEKNCAVALAKEKIPIRKITKKIRSHQPTIAKMIKSKYVTTREGPYQVVKSNFRIKDPYLK